MEHYKSRNNDFFHFTNPLDDRSELDDDDYDELQYCDDDDDRSCDFNFHTYRPLGINPSPPANSQTSGVMNKKDTVELGTFDNRALVLQLDNRMKSISDQLQHTIEGIGTRISRLDDETCKLDKHVEDVKNSEERYHGTTHKKLRQMQNILQEVQDGVLFLRDKHEIAQTQLELAKLLALKRDERNIAQTNPRQQLPFPPPPPSSHITPFLNQLPANGVTLSCRSVVSQAPPKISVEQYQTAHKNKETPQLPHFTQKYQLNSFQGVDPFLNFPSQETPNKPSYSVQHLPSKAATWGSPQQHQHEVGLPQSTHVQSSRNYTSKYMPEFASFSNVHPHGEPSSSSYEISNVKPVEFYVHPKEESSTSNYTCIPVAKPLPHALPTAIDVIDESRSEDNGNMIPVDDVVDKVTAMGFRREVVRACVRKLTVNGSQVDLNTVLDKMMKNK